MARLYLSIDERLVQFYLLFVVNNTTINIQAFCEHAFSFGYPSRGNTARSQNTPLNLLGGYQTPSKLVSTLTHFTNSVCSSCAPSPHQRVLSVFTLLMGVKWHLTVLLGTSQRVNDREQLFMGWSFVYWLWRNAHSDWSFVFLLSIVLPSLHTGFYVLDKISLSDIFLPILQVVSSLYCLFVCFNCL